MKKLLFLSLIILCFLCLTSPSSASVYDDFNDGSLDTNKWWPWTNPSPTIQLQEYSGSLNIDGSSGNKSRYGGLSSSAVFGGDFDIKMKWQDWSYSGGSGPYINDAAHMGIQVFPSSSTPDDNLFYIHRASYPDGRGDTYTSNAKVNGVWGDWPAGEVSTSADSGYFRITREGSTLSSYYSSDNQSWDTLYTVSNGFTDPVRIQPRGYTGDYTNSLHVEWDYVDVKANQLVPPETSPPENLPEKPPLTPRDQLVNLSEQSPNPNKPTIVVVHGRNPEGETSLPQWVDDIGGDISSRTFGSFNVLAWEWQEEAHTSIPNVLNRASWQAPLLSERLRNEGLTKSIHLIGHSAGARLVEETARHLERNNLEVEQLTFLDFPFYGGPLGINGGYANWADNYISSDLGREANNAFNFKLAGDDHSYAHVYYDETVRGLWGDEGFYWSLAGGGYEDRSPMASKEGTSGLQT